MSVNAKAILARARVILNDAESVRWTLLQLRMWLNDGLREMALIKPSAASRSEIFDLQAGTYQRLPDGYTSVLRVTRNLRSRSPRQPASIVRVVDRTSMDMQAPDWHDEQRNRPSRYVRNVVFDADEPTAFYVYPPNDGNGIVEAIAVRVPQPLPQPVGAVDDIESYDFRIDVQDIYANVLLDYVLYRAFSVDAQYAGSAAKADDYYAKFMTALGAKSASEHVNMNVRPTQENAA